MKWAKAVYIKLVSTANKKVLFGSHRIVSYFLLSALLSACVANVENPGGEFAANLIYSTSTSESDVVASFDFGFAAVGGFYETQLVVINTGRERAINLADQSSSTAFQYSGGAYPGTDGTCTNQLEPGASCVLTVRFSPASAVAETGEFRLGYADTIEGDKVNVLEVQGEGGTPASVDISEAPLFDYGLITIGASLDHVFTLSNTGQARAVSLAETGLSGDFAYTDGAYPGTVGNCPANLEILGGDSCTISVTFTPTNLGVQNQTINMDYFDGVANQTATRDVQGEGALPAIIEITEAPIYDYGTLIVGQTGSHLFTVSNTGGLTATAINFGGLAAPYQFTGGVFPGTGGNCGTTLTASSSCLIDVEFIPVGSGTFNDTIDISYNNGVALTVTNRDVTGAALLPASIQISDAPGYDFGTVAVGSSNDATLTLTNIGEVSATLTTGVGLAVPYSYAGGAYPGTGGTCTATLLPTATCTVVVNFTPVGAGVATDTADINYNNGLAVVTSSRNLTGAALPPATMDISDGPTFDFGTVAIGASISHTFTINNTGGVAATGVTATPLVAPFGFFGGAYPGTGGTCATSLPAGSSCTIVVDYTPAASALSVSSLDLNFNDGAGGQVSSRPIQGTGSAPAVISISDAPSYDYGSVAVGAADTYTFTLTNTGGFASSAMAGTGLVAPYAFLGGSYPGTGGTCGLALAATASCTIVVEYAPTVIAVHNDTIEINYNDGAVAQTATRDVVGAGIPPGLLTVSDGPLYDFGTIARTATSNHTFTITNTGGATVTSMADAGGLTAPFQFFGGTYPGTGGTCALSLATTVSCTVVVEFAPTVNGAFPDTIEISYNDGVGPQTATRDVQGSGADPALLDITNAPLYDFGNRAQGSTISQTFTVTNNGGVSGTSIAGLGLAAPFTYTGGVYPGTGGTCGASLAPTISCDIVVDFTPTALGLVTDSIQLDYDDGTAATISSTRDVQGTGVAPALLAISEVGTYDYGTVTSGANLSHTFNISNTGGFPAASITEIGLGAPFTFLGGAFPGTGGTCTASLADGASCSIVVDFAPTTTGLLSSNIQFTYDDGATTQTVTRPVQGTGNSPATLSISDAPLYDFGTTPVGDNVNYTFTLTNSGGSVATALSGSGLVAPYDFLGGSFPGTGGTCTATLGIGASCTFIVNYQPVATGVVNDTVIVSYNDGASAQTTDRDITSNALTPASITISESDPYDYGIQALGSSTPHTFTLTNGGGITATGLAESGLAPPFAFVGGTYPGTGGTCTTTLAGLANCTVVIEFSPVGLGPFSDTIQVDYNDGLVLQAATRDVDGTGANPALISVSDGPTYDFGSVATGASITHTFTLTNGGGVPATGIAGSGLGAPFSFLGGTYPGTGGTCTTALTSSGTCTVVVSYDPLVTGLQSDDFDIDYNDGAALQTTTRAVQGTGAAPAVLAISDAPSYDYGTVAIGSNSPYTFTITNTGGITATSITGGAFGTEFAFVGGAFPGTGGTCTATLASTVSCTVVVEFAPTLVAAAADTLTINYNDGATGQSSTRAITGTGANPALITISDGATFDYGLVANGGTTTHAFTLTNSGTITATGITEVGLAAPYDFLGGTFPGTGGTCGVTLAGAGTCTVVVEFAPTGIGVFTDTIDFNYNNGITVVSATRPVQGTGGAPALLSVSDGPTYDFGTQATGSVTAHTLTITNTGAVTATSIADAGGLAAPFAFQGGTYPGTGGTCGATLASSISCTVEVIFGPSAVLVSNDTMTLNYNDGAGPQVASRDLQGTGANPAALTISDGPTYDYGTLTTGTTASYTFTVSNGGGVAATSLADDATLVAPFRYLGGTYPGTGGTCGTSVLAGFSCTIVLEYFPSASGAFSDTIGLNYFDGASAQAASRDVQGAATTPATLTLSDAPTYDFGTVVIGNSTTHTFTVTNSGATTASSLSGAGIAAPYSFLGGSFPGAGGTCVATLAGSGGTCTVVLEYTPTVAGTQTDTVDINYNDGAVVQVASRDLTGTAVTPALIGISDGPSYDYNLQATGSSTPYTFTLTNTGGNSATTLAESGLAAPFNFLGGSYPGVGGTCGATLLSTATCTIVVAYEPSVAGAQTDDIQIDYNDGVGPQSTTRTLNGSAAAPALLTVSDGPTFDYGTIATGSTLTQTFTVNNGGGITATGIAETGLTAPYDYLGGTYPGTGGTCGATLAAVSSCTIVVEFAPALTGLQTDTIDFAYNDGAGPQTVTRPVQGTGAAPALLGLSDGPTYDFGNVTVGATSTYTFTLSNTGSVPATSLGGSGLVAPFTFLGGSYPGTGGTCTTTLANGANCTIVVEYAPTGSGANSDTIDISYNDGAAPQVAPRDVAGTGISAALLTLDSGPTHDYGLIANGGATTHTFTLTNSGQSDATAILEVGLALPFRFLGGGYPGTGGTCGATILGGGTTCTVVVEYAPTAIAADTDTIDFQYNDGANTVNATRAVQGSAGAPALLTVSDGPTYDYGTLATGSSTPYTFTVTNSGAVSATSLADGAGLVAPFVYVGGGYPGTGGTCGASLASLANCTVVVAYEPTGLVTSNDTLLLDYNDGAASQTATRDLAGTGAAPALLAISDGPTYDYGNVTVGGTSNYTFTVNNGGGVAATSLADGLGLAAPYSFLGGTYPGTGGTCAGTLSASGSCTIVVEYAPVGTGVAGDSIDLTYFNGAAAQTASRAVTANGLSAAVIAITDGPTYDFGTVPTGSNNTYTLTLNNTGGSTATSMAGAGLAAPFGFVGGSYPGTGGTCTTSLASLASCTVVIEYVPLAVNVDTDTMDITFNDGAFGQTSSRDISGTAVSPALITISESDPYNFGTLATGSSATHTFTLTNSGTFGATGLLETGIAAPFVYLGGSYPGTGGTCAATLAGSSATCTIVVQYAPSAVNVDADTIDFAYSDGVNPQTATRDVAGTAQAPALLTLSDGPNYDYGTVATGASVDYTFTVTNTGTFIATSITEVGLAAPFAYAGGSFPGTGGTCTTSLVGGASCTVVFAYSPTGTGAQSDTIDFSYDNGATTVNVTGGVQGTGAAPALITVTDGPTYDFGNVTVGATSTYTFTLNNTGSVPATSMGGSGLVAPYSFLGGSYPGTGGTCTTTLANAANCTIVVEYAPTGVGANADTIDINYNDGAALQIADRDITGTGLSAALLTLDSGPTHDYGLIANGGVSSHTFTITNSGQSDATAILEVGLALPFRFLGGGYPGTGGTCGATILGGGTTCTVVVEYAPTAVAADSDTIDFQYSDGANTVNATRAVQGSAGAPALVAISDGPTYDYGNQATGSNTNYTFTLSNSGAVSATSMVDAGALAAPYGYLGGTYPGTGGTCGASIPTSGSCTIVVTFSPGATGAFPDQIDINYEDGAVGGSQTASRAVTGTGVNPALLSISDGPTYDYTSITTGATATHTFTINNTGGVAATSLTEVGLAAPYSFLGGGYPGTGGTCTATLNDSASCTVVVEYAPLATGIANDTLDLQYFNGAATTNATRDLTGNGLAPAVLAISNAPTYDFGTVPTGSNNTQTLTINNTGGSTATSMAGAGLVAPFGFLGGSYPGTGGTCVATLASLGNCTIVVEYVPIAVNVDADTVEIGYNDGAALQTATRDLAGTAVSPALITISESDPYNFGTLATGSNATHTFTLTNSGTFGATGLLETGIAAPFVYLGGSYPGTGGTCAATLAGSSTTCTIVVQYAPSAVNVDADTIDFAYNDGVNPQTATRDVAGTAQAPALLTLSDGPNYDYGTVATGASVDYTFTVTNTGTFIATSITEVGLAAPFAYAGGAFPGTGGTCTTSLVGGASCTVVFAYSPTGTGAQSDTIDFSYDNGATTVNVTGGVQGTGAAPALLGLSDGPTYDFGNVTVGSTSTYTFTLSNTGSVPATSLGGSGLVAPYTFLGGSYPGTGGTCGTSLANGANCTLVVEYAPVGVGANADTIDINYNDGAALQVVNRAVTGTGISAALLTLDSGPTHDYGLIANGGTTTHTFTITNSGQSDATAILEVGLALPFRFLGGGYPGTGGTCGATILGGGTTCTVVVEYAPTAVAADTDTIDFQYNDGANTVNATRAIQGSAGARALLTVSDGPTYNYGTFATGSSTSHTFTVTNSGAVSATSLADGAGLAAPFVYVGGGYPGTGGTCGASIANGASCTLVIAYEPTGLVTSNDTVILNYNDGAGPQTTSRDLSGTGAAPALLTISDGPTYDYGNLTVGATVTQTFTVSNGGGVAAIAVVDNLGLAAPYSFLGGAYPGTGGTCAGTLSASGSCTIVVEYAPSGTGVTGDSIDLGYFDGAATQSATRAVTANGLSAAVLAITDGPTYDFGTVPTGSNNTYTLTLNNTGGSPATSMAGAGLAAPFGFVGGSYPGTGGTCTTSLASLVSCTVVIEYVPLAVNVDTDTMDITFNDGAFGQTSSRALSGTAVSPALITISESDPYNFGTLATGSSATHTFTLTNSGTFGATGLLETGISAPFVYLGGSYPGTGGTCAATLAGSSTTCTIVVQYAPSAVNVDADTIDFAYNDGVNPQTATRDVAGTAQAPALLTLSDGPNYDYGTLATGASANHTFTVTNTGTFIATSILEVGLAAPFAYAGGAFPGTGGTCATSLVGGASCTVVFAYSPTGTGAQSDTIDFNYDNGATTVNVTGGVQGTGAAPALIGVSDGPTYDFGNVTVGSTATYTLTLSNTGSVPATSMGGSGLVAPFTFLGGSYPGTGGTCTTTLANGGNCTVVVEYAPAGVGANADTIDINYNDGAALQVANRDVTGTGISAALLTLDSGPTHDYGLIANGGTATHTFTITNSGQSDATAITELGLALPFRFLGGGYPGTGGTCGATILGGGTTCTIIVEYAPTAIAADTDTIDFQYSDGANTVNATRDIQGSAGAPASLAISDGPTYNYGTFATGSSNQHIFTVTNSGAVSATSLADGAGLAVPFVYVGGSYPGTGGNCGASLANGASCTLVIAYEPTGLVTSNDTVILNYNDGAGPQTTSRDLSGTGASPALLTITDGPTYDFGSVTVGATNTYTFTINNGGGVTATAMVDNLGLAVPYSFLGGAYPGTGGTCAGSLSAAGSCTIVVEYAPVATGVVGDTIDVGYFDGSATQSATRAVTGNGLSVASITISELEPYNFGTVPTGSINNFTFTLTNGGGSSAVTMAGGALSAPYSFLGGTYPGTGGTCGTTLTSGGNCTVVVSYTPVAVNAPDTETISVSYNDGVNPQAATRGLTAAAVAPALLDISESDPYNFGNFAIGANQTHTFTVTNNGGFNASGMVESGIAAPFIYFGGTYPGTGGTCSTDLGATASCTIVVQYSPATAALEADTISFAYNDGVNPQTTTRDIQGTGSNPASLTISGGPTFDYGTNAVGSTLNNFFTVSNTGGFVASSILETGLALPYRFVGGTYPGSGGTCGATINPSSSCTLNIEFVPTGTGLVADTIIVQYDDGATTQTTSRNIQGTGSSAATLVISEINPYDFNNVTIGAPTTHTFTVTNSGGVDATSVSGAGLVAPYSFLGGTYPGTGGTCGTTIISGNTCSIVIEFAPIASGLTSDTIEISFNDGAGAASSNRIIQGTGATPAFLVVSESDPYNFGVIADGGDATHIFTINNTGETAATSVTEVGLAAPFDFLGGSFPGTGGTCSTVIGPGTNCTVVVEFDSSGLIAYADTMSFSYSDGVGTSFGNRDIQGTSGAPATLDISSGPTYDYGTAAVGSTLTQTFTINNAGAVAATSITDPLTLGAPFTYQGGTYPGVGGTCGASLAASTSCTVVVDFAPSIVGLQSDNISLNFNNGASVVNSSRAVQGTGATVANLSISELDPYDFGSLPVGATLNHTFTITNGGGVSATSVSEVGLSGAFDYLGGTYPGTGGTCGGVIANGANCTIVVEFAPGSTGTQLSTVTMSYFNGASTQNSVRNIQGEGVAVANITISETEPYSFVTLATGATATNTFTLTNAGGFIATSIGGSGLAAPYAFLGGSYPGTGGTCGASLAPTNSCTIVVEYAPSGTGTTPDTIDIGYNDGVNTVTSSRGITGSAVNPGLLTISETSPFSFGSRPVGFVQPHTFTITNTGDFQVSGMSETGLATPYRYAGGSYPGTGGTCGATLAGASTTCTIVVEFAPTIPATYNDTITFNYNDGAGPQTANRDVTGIAVAAAQIDISESDPYDFGNVAVGATASHVFTLTNNGGFTANSVSEVSMAAPFTFTGGGYPGATGNCGATLSPTASCTIDITFTPSATGLASDDIEISYDNGVSVQVSARTIQGTGVAEALLNISEINPYDFGNVTQGGSGTHTFTITNSGGVTATSVGGSGLTAPFSFLGSAYPGTGGTCGTSIAASASCTVIVEYSPSAVVTSADTIDINYFDGANPATSSRNIQGTGIAPAVIDISEADPYDFGLIANGGTTNHTFTLTNNGSSLASAIGEVGLNPPFQFLGGGYPGTGGNCGATLSPTASCTIVVEFNPSALGTPVDTIDMSYNNGAVVTNSTRDVQGTSGTPATLDYAASPSFNYNTVANGATVTQTFTITNNGAVPATAIVDAGTMALPFAFNGGSYPGVGGTCGGTLVNSNSCTIVVDFQPSISGAQTDNIALNFNNGAGVVASTLTLNGTGAAPALIGISESNPYDFGSFAVGGTSTHTFTVSNTGGVAATSLAEVGLAAPFDFLGGIYPGTGGTCAATLGASGNCTIVVEYTPTIIGVDSDSIEMSYNNGVSTVVSARVIQGTAVSAASLAISDGPTHNFGNVTEGDTTTYTFTVTNSGGLDATSVTGAGIVAPFIYDGGSYPGTGGTCAGTITGGGSCTIVVRYSPVAAGLQTDVIEIDYNDGAVVQTASRAIEGTGRTPALLTVSDGPTYDYGSVATSTTNNYTFTVAYTGQTTATSVTGAGLAAPYSYLGGTYPGTGGTCGAVISADCTIVVSYNPTGAGTFNDTIDLTYDNGAITTSSTRDVTGQASDPAILSISEGEPYDMGSVVTTGTINHVFTISNTGSFAATSLSEIGLTAPYDYNGGSFPGTGGNCTTTIAASTSCTVDIAFNPTVTGIQTDTINYSYNDGTGPQNATRGLTAEGLSPALLTISDGPTYDYGVNLSGTTATRSFTVNNGGGVAATSIVGGGLIAPYTYLGGTYPGTGGSCGTTINSGANCTIVVAYNPVAAQTDNDSIDISYNNGAITDNSTRDVTGQGVNNPDAPTTLTLLNPATTPNADTTPEITVGGGSVANGVTVRIYSDSSCGAGNILGTAVSSGTSVNITSSALSAGTTTIYANLTDTFGFPSGCSTANVAYEVDNVAPNAPTLVSHALTWHNNLSTTPTVNWTVSVSPDVNFQEIGVSASPAGGNDAGGYNTIGSAVNSTTVTGLGLTACVQYYATVRAVDNAGNTSSLAPATVAFRVDTDTPTAPGGGTLAMSDFASGTQAQIATWGASTDTCGVIGYEISMGTSAGATDVQNWIDIGNVTTYRLQDTVDGASFALAGSTNYFVNVRAYDAAGFAFSAVSSGGAFQTQAPNAVTDLLLAERASTQISLTWTDPGSVGAPATDYLVYYRTSGPGAWTLFADGVSASTTATVTGLTASTAYDFMVQATNGTPSGDSNIVTASTGPNTDFFDPTLYTAINLGGADNGCRVIAEQAGTAISINGTPTTTIATAGGTYDFACAQFDEVSADGPIYAMGNRGNAQHIGWHDRGLSGTEFYVNGSRNAPHEISVYAFEASTVEFFRDGVSQGTQVLAAGASYVYSDANNGAFRVTSTALIGAYFLSTSGIADGQIMPPAANKLIGYSSNSGRISPGGSGTATISRSNATDFTAAITNGALYTIAGTGNRYSGDIQKVEAPFLFGINSYADSDGGCSAPWVSPALFRENFMIAGDTDWVALGAESEFDVEVVDLATGTVEQTVTLVGASSTGLYRYYFPALSIGAGRVIRSVNSGDKFIMWYQPRSQTTYQENDDETLAFGFD